MPKDPITFRLERDVRPLLEQAAKQAGLKVSNYVEETVLEKLGDTDRLRTCQELELLRSEVTSLREELSLAEALSYQDSFGYRVVYPEPDKVNLSAKKDLNSFLGQWLSNLKSQGHR